MIPQQQLRKEQDGDCLRACIASLMELPIIKVPDFTKDRDPLGAMTDVQDWLNARGLAYVEVALPENMPWNPLPFPALCIFLGETKNGVKHAIVGVCEQGFREIFNPWPEAEFAGGVAAVAFIVPRDPASYIRMGRGLAKIDKLSAGYEGYREAAIGQRLVEINMESKAALGNVMPLAANGSEHNG